MENTNVMISNAKAFILGTFHGLPKKNLDLYLSEFCFRFNRRSMICLNAWLSRFVAHFYLTKGDNQIIK